LKNAASCFLAFARWTLLADDELHCLGVADIDISCFGSWIFSAFVFGMNMFCCKINRHAEAHLMQFEK
jgi:hypothetical protein